MRAPRRPARRRCIRGGRGASGPAPRRVRLARLRRAVAAVVPVHVEHLHVAAAAEPVRCRAADEPRDLDPAARWARPAARLARAHDLERRLVLFRRRYRFEATTASAIALVFAVYTAGTSCRTAASAGAALRDGRAAVPPVELPFALARWRMVTLVIGRVVDRRRAPRPAHLVGDEQAPVQGLAGDCVVARRPLAPRSGALLMLSCGAAAGLVAVLSGRGCYRTRR